MKRSREVIYDLFAHIFAREPAQEVLERAGSIFSDCLSDMGSLSVKEQVGRLSEEYARLFLPPKRLAPLLESLQMGEGRLWGETTVAVNRLYEKFGFSVDDSFRETPDHISVELSFLSQLTRYRAEELKKYFLKEHLLVWFPGVKKDVEANAQFCYYKKITESLGMFLDDEWERLKEVKDV